MNYRRSDQLSLLVPEPMARKRDPQTSKDAASSMRAAATAQCAKVLTALRDLGQAGAEQIGYKINMAPYAIRKRLAELCQAGLIAPTGKTRKTESGRSERVWGATQIF